MGWHLPIASRNITVRYPHSPFLCPFLNNKNPSISSRFSSYLMPWAKRKEALSLQTTKGRVHWSHCRTIGTRTTGTNNHLTHWPDHLSFHFDPVNSMRKYEWIDIEYSLCSCLVIKEKRVDEIDWPERGGTENRVYIILLPKGFAGSTC